MMNLERRLCRLEATHRQQPPIIMAVARAPSGDVLEAWAAGARIAGRRLLCVVTGIPRSPGDPIGGIA